MKGLLYKDLFAVVKYYKTYFFLILVFMAASWLDPENLFYSLYPCILVGSIIMSLISMDESSKWNMTCGFLPFTQTQLVCVKYLLGLVLASVFLLLAVGGQLVRMIVQDALMWEELGMMAVMMVSCGFLMPGLMLPFIYKFGVEKGRLVYLIVLGGSAGLLAFFGTNGMMTEFMVDLPVALIALAALALYGGSCLISIGICKRKNG